MLTTGVLFLAETGAGQGWTGQVVHATTFGGVTVCGEEMCLGGA